MASTSGTSGVNENAKRPYKISGKTKQFKGIVASSLAELKSKAFNALQIPSSNEVKIFLEEDLTEVDNEEYFNFLPAQTKFIVLQRGEKASFGVQAAKPLASLERSESLITKAPDCIDGVPKVDPELKQKLTSDPIFYINMNDDELERVIALDPSTVSQELDMTTEEIVLYQESCERELLRRSELRDAHDLLKLYQRVKKVDKKDDSQPISKKSKIS